MSPNAVDEIRTRQIKLIPGDGFRFVVEQRAGVFTQQFFNAVERGFCSFQFSDHGLFRTSRWLLAAASFALKSMRGGVIIAYEIGGLLSRDNGPSGRRIPRVNLRSRCRGRAFD